MCMAQCTYVHVVSRAGCLVEATDMVSVGCASLCQRCVGFGARLGPLGCQQYVVVSARRSGLSKFKPKTKPEHLHLKSKSMNCKGHSRGDDGWDLDDAGAGLPERSCTVLERKCPISTLNFTRISIR